MRTEPIQLFGAYDDIDEGDYHSERLSLGGLGRTLSASGAKALLEDPAKFAYERAHPKVSSKAMDTGSIAHTLVLGRGAEVVVVPSENWLKKADQEEKKAIVASGRIPANLAEMAKAQAMADAVLEHPTAGPLFTGGRAEVSLYWRDEVTGVPMRGRVDYLVESLVVDLKSTADPGPEAFAKSCANYGYREAAANYVDGVRTLTGRAPDFVLVAVSSAPPHQVRLYRFGLGDLEYGAARMHRAQLLFQHYEEVGYPEYHLEVEELVMPAWAIGDTTDPTAIRDVGAMAPGERF